MSEKTTAAFCRGLKGTEFVSEPTKIIHGVLLCTGVVAVDDFRFKKRMPSRAAAVRELLRRGLAAEGFGLALAGAKSADFCVIGDAPSQIWRGAERR